MITVKCTYSKKYYPQDTLYTFKSADTLKKGQVVWTKDSRTSEWKQVLVVSVDKEYDLKTEKRFGQLAEVFATKPDEEMPTTVRKSWI